MEVIQDKTEKIEILKSLEAKSGFEVEKEFASRAKHPETLIGEKRALERSNWGVSDSKISLKRP